MQHSRRMWDIDHAVHLLRNMRMEPHFIAHFTEYPQCGNAGEESTIDKLFGKPFVSNPACYNGAQRARNMRTAPGGLEVKMFHHPIDPTAAVDGWTWKGNGAGCDSKHPQVTLRSFAVKLMETRDFRST